MLPHYLKDRRQSYQTMVVSLKRSFFRHVLVPLLQPEPHRDSQPGSATRSS
jgi:hypothetical protein